MKKSIAAAVLLLSAFSVQAQGVASDAGIEPHTLSYQMTLNAMGQEIVIPTTRTLSKIEADGRSLWRIVDVAELPETLGGGTAVDTFEVTTGTLLPVRRSSASMGGVLTFNFDGGQVKGLISSPMGEIRVDTTYAGMTVMGDGGAFELLMAGLPLEVGYDETFNVFSPQVQGVREMRVHVTGEDTVTTPAGAFEVFVIDFAPTDGSGMGASTVMVTKAAPHIGVRSETGLGPQMGNGTAVVELQSKQ